MSKSEHVQATRNEPISGLASWNDVEQLLERLAETHEPILTDVPSTTRITANRQGDRLQLESELGTKWLEVDNIRACWETFERLGQIRRRDVLEPGRCSAFMFGLFRQVPGVVERDADELYLVLHP